ncbi:MAG: hypothetical protein HYX35_01430 [Proteobacteria bacterium]|nr:hypothetical protein [Pseudomonadota bacterium]
MKKTIFLLGTISLLAATPILAMEGPQDVTDTRSTTSLRPLRPIFSKDLTPDYLQNETLIEDLEKHASFLKTTDDGVEECRYVGKTSVQELSKFIRSIKSTSWNVPTSTTDSITFHAKTSWLVLGTQVIDLPFNRFKSVPVDPLLETSPSTGTTLKSPPLLQDWIASGLTKTNPIVVTEGQTLTVTCDFEPATEVTEISFLNSAQNAYYPGGVTVQPGETRAVFTSTVPTTWLVIRHPGFNGTDTLTLGVVKFKALDIELK